jgi:type IV secretion system protein VirD4
MSARNNAVGPQIRTGQAHTIPYQALGGALALIGGLAGATQYFAHEFGGQVALGTHLNGIYPPWRILAWAAHWHTQLPEALMRAGSVGMAIAAVGLFGVFILKMVAENTSRPQEFLHGSARWAGLKDIRAAGLLANDGVYVGAWVDPGRWGMRGRLRYLRHNGPEHVLCYAPTRSGKGVGLVIPTLLSWPHSAVVTDLKGELWALTAGWRKRHAGNKVLRFEPASETGCAGFNPLDEIRVGTGHEVGDVQNLATLLVDPDGKGLTDHWQKSAQALLVGCILHVLHKRIHEGTPANLAEVDAILANPGQPVAELWVEMVEYVHGNGERHPIIGKYGQDMIDTPVREAGSKVSSAKSYLSLYRDPVIAKNMARSAFRIADLMNADSPVTLYIITQPTDKARLRPLVRIVINMIVRMLAGKMEFDKGRPKPHYRHRLLMMLDEFASLGRLEIMQESLAFLAGYGIKCYLICQDLAQLKSKETGYGPEESITSNCHIQNAYPPNRVETAEYLSKMTGQTTIIKTAVTTSGKRTGWLGQASKTMQEVQRPLLTVDEALRMPGPEKDWEGNITTAGDMVIYAAGRPAIYGRQPLYFKDPVFQARAEIPPPITTDTLIKPSVTGSKQP